MPSLLVNLEKTNFFTIGLSPYFEIVNGPSGFRVGFDAKNLGNILPIGAAVDRFDGE
jgi:hypothetical protein